MPCTVQCVMWCIHVRCIWRYRNGCDLISHHMNRATTCKNIGKKNHELFIADRAFTWLKKSMFRVHCRQINLFCPLPHNSHRIEKAIIDLSHWYINYWVIKPLHKKYHNCHGVLWTSFSWHLSQKYRLKRKIIFCNSIQLWNINDQVKKNKENNADINGMGISVWCTFPF